MTQPENIRPPDGCELEVSVKKKSTPMTLVFLLILAALWGWFGQGGNDGPPASRGTWEGTGEQRRPEAGQRPQGLHAAGKQRVGGVTVVNQRDGGTIELGTVDLAPTLERIAAGKRNSHRNDGSVFRNASRQLPAKPRGYYHEYVVPTPGISGPGPQRLVIGENGEVYYTPNHYDTFIRVEL